MFFIFFSFLEFELFINSLIYYNLTCLLFLYYSHSILIHKTGSLQVYQPNTAWGSLYRSEQSSLYIIYGASCCSCETPNNGRRGCIWPSCPLLGPFPSYWIVSSNLDIGIYVQSSCNRLCHVQLIFFAFFKCQEFPKLFKDYLFYFVNGLHLLYHPAISYTHI